MMSTEVPDGATQRHSRLMEMLSFIATFEPDGCTLTTIQAHMLAVFGLKFKTTAEMIREAGIAGFIQVDGHGKWRLTETERELLSKLRQPLKGVGSRKRRT